MAKKLILAMAIMFLLSINAYADSIDVSLKPQEGTQPKQYEVKLYKTMADKAGANHEIYVGSTNVTLAQLKSQREMIAKRQEAQKTNMDKELSELDAKVLAIETVEGITTEK